MIYVVDNMIVYGRKTVSFFGNGLSLPKHHFASVRPDDTEYIFGMLAASRPLKYAVNIIIQSLSQFYF